MIQIQELTFQYRKRPILDAVSFSVEKGEIVGVLGVNGAGKSTLLRILSGLIKQSRGSIQSPYTRRQMGVVFQECSLDVKLTAHQNLSLSGQVYGLSRKERKSRIMEGLHYFNLKGVENDAVKTFSGGMKRKVELLRATLHHPLWLLMDEPSAGLDAISFSQFWNLLARHKKEYGMSALVATHRIDEAENCDRLLVLHEGRVVANESPSTLKAQVHGDRIRLTFASHVSQDELNSWQERLRSVFEITVERNGHEFEMISSEGHKLVPRLVDALPDGSVESIYVRRPTLADAFLQLTGASL